MRVNRIRQNVLPVLAALIWGTAFVAQSVGADYVEAFTFNAARAAVAFLFCKKIIAWPLFALPCCTDGIFACKKSLTNNN